MGETVTFIVPDFDDEEDETDLNRWLQIAIWIIGVVIDLLKKIKEVQALRGKRRNK